MNGFHVLVFAFFAGLAFAKDLPNFIPTCKRSSPEFNACFKMATATLQPKLAKGIKELNLPLLEPLEIPMVKLEQGTGAVSYKAVISKIKMYGLSDYKFEELAASFYPEGKDKIKGARIGGTIDLPRIRLVADYDIKGRVLLLPIQGNGEFTANITDCKAQFGSTSDLIKKKGAEYLQAKDVQLRLDIGGAMVHFGNLFNGDPILSKTTNDFFNANAKDILNEVKPAIEAVAAMVVEDIFNKVFHSAPFEKLFPK